MNDVANGTAVAKPKGKWTLNDLELPPMETQRFRKELMPAVLAYCGVNLCVWFVDDESFRDEYSAFVDWLFKKTKGKVFESRLTTHREIIDKLVSSNLAF